MDEKHFYSNRVFITASSHDVYFKLQEIVPEINTNDGKIIGEKVNDELALFMSVQHAKSFLKALDSQIQEHEKTFGKIDLGQVQKEN